MADVSRTRVARNAGDDEESGLQPAARALLHHMMGTNGELVSYQEIAVVIGSSTGDPRSLVKVHMHALRKASSKAWMIAVVRGRGLRWTSDPSDATCRNDNVSDRMIGILRSHPGRLFSDAALTEACGSTTSNPSNLVKVMLHRMRSRKHGDGGPLPIRRIRGRGLVWDRCGESLSEHDEREGESREPRGQ